MIDVNKSEVTAVAGGRNHIYDRVFDNVDYKLTILAFNIGSSFGGIPIHDNCSSSRGPRTHFCIVENVAMLQ